MSDLRDKFRGCLIGGAAGDALGYAVEFKSLQQIRDIYGGYGITEYELRGGLARISDDTQMTMFSANGLICGYTETHSLLPAVGNAYRDWYLTQTRQFPLEEGESVSWLTDLPEMFALRAPGNTCLSSLSRGWNTMGSLQAPCNNSKGCGAVMRAAPFGLTLKTGDEALISYDYFAAEAGALTHGHKYGWMSAAMLAHIVALLAYGRVSSVREAAEDAIRWVPEWMQLGTIKNPGDTIRSALDLAAEKNLLDRKALAQIGEGWVGEEALAVAIYCAVKYEDDFDRALITAVNHDGDSDSTGAICGNILGAKIGYDAIPKKYKTDLELHDTLLTLADDLYSMHDPAVTESSEWKLKYDREYYGDYDEDEEWEDDE